MSGPIARSHRLLPIALFALAAGCDPRTPTTVADNQPAPGNPNPTLPPLQLSILEPTGDLAMSPGAAAHVVISSLDPIETASIRLIADRDGDLATTSDQLELATTTASASTTPREVAVALAANTPPGSYVVAGTIADGVRAAVTARAHGRLIVEDSHSLSIQEPATNVTVSRGGQLRVVYAPTDADGMADVRFVADVDGDVATTGDQYPLGSVTTAMQTPQAIAVSLTGLPLGDYRIIGVAEDPGHADVVAVAPGRVHVANVAFATQDGGTDYEEGRAITVLPDGSIVTTGRFAGSSLFGEWPTFTSLNASGDDDLFLARYSPTGALTWTLAAGGPSRGDWGNALATFPDGSILVGGYFHGLASFNGGPLAGGLLSAGEDDAFLARYSPNGVLAWARRAGGVFHDDISGVATFANGDVVATGTFAAQGTFGEGAATATLLVGGSLLSSDGFLARYHGDGSLAWVEQFGGAAGNDAGISVAAIADGSCVVTGTFTGTATFGKGVNLVTLSAAGGTDVFVARYDATGTLLWARRGGGPDDDVARGITLAANGDVVVCGGFGGTATFGTAADLQTLQAAGSRDAFVVRFTANGGAAWARSAGGANEDEARGITALPDGGCVITGSFHTFATFATTPSPKTLTAFGLRDVFVARYDASGSLLWAKRAGGTNHDLGNAITSTADGSLIVSGSFQGDATFGVGAGARTLSATGLGDVFLVRYNADGEL